MRLWHDIINHMLSENKINLIQKVFEANNVKLGYLFGSQATGNIGSLSDYDFAVYLATNDPKLVFVKKISIQTAISQILGTDQVDIVVLDTASGSELKYNIIKDGKIIFEKEPYKITLEPAILNEYFDFKTSLRQFGLTKT